MNDKKIIEKYKDKVLGVESFGQNKKLYIKDLFKKDLLLDELYKMDCHEVSLTEDGLSFIEEYYKIEDVVDMILDEIKNGVDYKYSEKADIVKWLKLGGNV